MCFRPPTAAQTVTCPKCGEVNPSVTDICLNCDASLLEVKSGQAAPMDAPTATGNQVPPREPSGASSISAPPKQPGAPKPPKRDNASAGERGIDS